ncbi:MAG: DUF4157 domain-containing protein [Anaerolineae bacterium]
MSIQNKGPKGQKGKRKREKSRRVQGKTPQPERPSSTTVTQPTPNDDLQRTIETVTGLQQTIGNQAIGHLLIQPKLTLGPVGDKYEQEADAVAKQVVNRFSASDQPTAQRQEEEELQMKPVTAVQRQEEEEPVMTKSTSSAEGGPIAADLENEIQAARSSGQSLDKTVRAPMEQAFSADFSGVKVHTDAQSDTLNQSLQARAFTTGQDIFFRQGEYNPGSSAGQELLAHELTHVTQQNANLQAPRVQRVFNQTNYNNFIKQYGGNEEGTVLHTLLKGLTPWHLKSLNPEENLDKLFDNFQNIAFKYTMTSMSPEKLLKGTRAGDCSTLARTFQKVAVACLGIDGVTTSNAGRNEPYLTEAGKTIDPNRSGNCNNAERWFFQKHRWAEYAGKIYDVLFHSNDLGDADPMTRTVKDEQAIGGEYYVMASGVEVHNLDEDSYSNNAYWSVMTPKQWMNK